MSESYTDIEQKILLAVGYHQSHPTTKLAEVARIYSVPYQRFKARVHGRGTRSSRPPTNQRLTDGHVKALDLHCQRLDAAGMPPMLPRFAAAIDTIRYPTATAHERVHFESLKPQFVRRFTARHPQFHRVKQMPQEKERAHAQDREVYMEHFVSLEKVIKDLGTVPPDIRNFDECGFRIGIGGSQFVTTLSNNKRMQSPSQTNRDFVTVIEAISADGGTISPFVILRGSQILHSHVSTELDLDPHLAIGVSESGYTNDQLALEYLDHFIHPTRYRRRSD